MVQDGIVDMVHINQVVQFKRIIVFVLFLLALTACSTENSAKDDRMSKERFRELCNEYAHIYKTDGMPKYTGYFDARSDSISSAVGSSVLRGVREYHDVLLRRDRTYVGTAVKGSIKKYYVDGTGYRRVYVDSQGGEHCVAPLQDVISKKNIEADPLQMWVRAKGKCLAVKQIEESEIRFSNQRFRKSIDGMKNTWIEGSRFRRGLSGEVLVEVADVRHRYVTMFGNVQFMSCIGRATEALSIANRERFIRHGHLVQLRQYDTFEGYAESAKPIQMEASRTNENNAISIYEVGNDSFAVPDNYLGRTFAGNSFTIFTYWPSLISAANVSDEPIWTLMEVVVSNKNSDEVKNNVSLLRKGLRWPLVVANDDGPDLELINAPKAKGKSYLAKTTGLGVEQDEIYISCRNRCYLTYSIDRHLSVSIKFSPVFLSDWKLIVKKINGMIDSWRHGSN